MQITTDEISKTVQSDLPFILNVLSESMINGNVQENLHL